MKFKCGSLAFAEEHERMPGIKSVNYFRSKDFFICHVWADVFSIVNIAISLFCLYVILLFGT